METLLVGMIVVAVVAVAGVLFCVWAAVAAMRGLARMVFGPRKPAARVADAQDCVHGDCLCPNPGHARFCRRCGRPLPGFMRLVGSRAA